MFHLLAHPTEMGWGSLRSLHFADSLHTVSFYHVLAAQELW